MNFVWDMNEKDWNKFTNAVKRNDLDLAYMEGEYLGCCRVGDLCFDIRAWHGGEWAGWGFELFCGGVDSGYGYSSREAMAIGKYKNKHDVPDELLYPYDEIDYGEFPNGFASYSLAEFQSKAEPIFEELIRTSNYDGADLLAKAEEPLHIW